MRGAIDFQSAAPALWLEGRRDVISYRELGQRVAAALEQLQSLPRPALVFQFATGGAAAVVSYLACLEAGLPLGLGEPAGPARDRIIASYQPTALWLVEGEPAPAGYESVGTLRHGGMSLWRRTGPAVYAHRPHRDLALLLATSGSTGDAKLVRLSAGNLEANARSIAGYLGLGPGEIAAQSLPLHYSYGLSVLNSHLLCGGAVMLTAHSFMRPEFWRSFDECGCTSFAGVPYMYETMQRLRMAPADRPTLRTATQAGGHLRVEVARHFHDALATRGKRMFVMYGQTEATARISYVPAERLGEKLGSIGVAIPGGQLSLESMEDDPGVKQLLYRGPNVMLGYASEPADLERGDDQKGRLATGDLAECDADGFFRITGRLGRFAKLFGKRINLAGIELELEQRFGHRAAAIDGGDQLPIFLENASAAALGEARAHLAALLGVPPPALKIGAIDKLPMTASGKKDYKALQ